jgi:hypothetical protein
MQVVVDLVGVELCYWRLMADWRGGQQLQAIITHKIGRSRDTGGVEMVVAVEVVVVAIVVPTKLHVRKTVAVLER